MVGRKQKESALLGAIEEIKLFDSQDNLLDRKGKVTLMAPAQFLTTRADGING